MGIFDLTNQHHARERLARKAAAAASSNEMRDAYLASATRHADAAWRSLDRMSLQE